MSEANKLDELTELKRHCSALEAERDLLANKVRGVQQELDFLRHVADDEAAPADKREGIKAWCALLQAALDHGPDEGLPE